MAPKEKAGTRTTGKGERGVGGKGERGVGGTGGARPVLLRLASPHSKAKLS